MRRNGWRGLWASGGFVLCVQCSSGPSMFADGFGSDAAAADRPSPPVDAGAMTGPFDVPPNTWTWRYVAGAQCANGEPTGVGVNVVPGSDEVMLFFKSGGACWSAETCWGEGWAYADHIRGGYGPRHFATDDERKLWPLLRDAPDNPFRAMTMVYLPYCTGDVFVGDHVASYTVGGRVIPTHHVGYRNVGLVLERLAQTVPTIRRIWLVGDSAGGFGALVNWDRTQRRFPDARVDVLDDSGPPFPPTAARQAAWLAAWNPQLPSDCEGCSSDFGRLVGYYSQKYPAHHFGLLSYTSDFVISLFTDRTIPQMQSALRALTAEMDLSWPQGHYYVVSNTSHVVLLNPTTELRGWINDMVHDAPSWRNRPAR